MQADSSDNGWESSAEAWVRCVDDAAEVNRKRILDGPMLQLCGQLAGKRVLDVGCGEGRFCRMLAESGAAPTGIDPTQGLLTVARERHPAGQYLCAEAEALPFPDAEFDLVISYLTLIDIPDYRAAIREMARVLKPGGRLVIANLNGFCTATLDGWKRDGKGEKLHWTFDNYMQERWVWAAWAGIRIKNYHRPHSAYMQALLGTGLRLDHFDEPQLHLQPGETGTPLKEALENARMPYFLVMRWVKDGAEPSTVS